MKPRKPIARSQKPIRKRSAKKIEEDKGRRQLKKAVVERDGNRCNRCKARGVLDLHELKSRGSGGKATMENCVLLCRWCHRNVTDHTVDDWRMWVHVKKEGV